MLTSCSAPLTSWLHLDTGRISQSVKSRHSWRWRVTKREYRKSFLEYGSYHSPCQVKMLMITRIKNWKPQRSGNGKQNSWKCSVKKSQEVVEMLFLGHRYTLPIHLQLAMLSQIRTIHTRLRRTNPTSTFVYSATNTTKL